MSKDEKYLLVDGKYLLNADHVKSIGSMHTVQELSDKSQAPSEAADLTQVSYTEQSYQASCDVGDFGAAGSINLNLTGNEIMADIGQYSSQKGVRSAMSDESVMFSWVSE